MKYFLLLLVIFVFMTLSGDEFWTEVQKDSFHSGRVDVDGEITEPEISWKYYRGGSLSPENVIVDSENNIYFSINGVVRAFDGGLNLIWESERFGAGKIFKITDLNNDGEKELVIAGEDGIKIVSILDGSIFSTVETESPTFAKLADLNDDGVEDLVVRGMWGVRELRAYSFSNSILNCDLFWEINEKISSSGIELCVGDINKDNKKELVTDRSLGGLISVFKADDGSLLSDKEGILNGNYAYGFNEIVNVDDDIQNEFVISGSISAEADKGSYSITIYDYVKDSVQWQYEYGVSSINYGFRMVPGSVGDFNGDGVIDVVISVFNNTLEGENDLDGVNAPNIWTTLIYKGDDGILQARIDNKYLDGIIDIDDDGKSEFVLRDAPDASRQLREYSEVSLFGFVDGGFSEYWSKEKVKILPTDPEDTEEVGVTFVDNVLSVVSSGSEKAILMVEDINRDGIADRIFSVGGKDPPVFSDNTYLSGGEKFGFIHSTDSDIYFTGNDGFLHIFKRGKNLFEERTISTGTFNADSILINSMSGEKMLSQISTSSSVLLDPKEASIITEPEIVWSKVNQFSQPVFALDSDGDGVHEFISVSNDSEGYTDLYLHSSEGGLLWGWTVGKTMTPPKNFISGDFDGDGYKDVAFTFTSEEEGDALYTLKGFNGSVLGSYIPQDSGYYNYSIALLGDINSDGASEIILFHAPNGDVINGMEMELSFRFEVDRWAYNPSVSDFTGNNVVEIFANQRAGDQKQIFDLEGEEIWKIEAGEDMSSFYKYYTPYPGISKIDSDDGFDLVLGGKFGDVSAYSGADGTVLWRRCLSGGESTDVSVSVIPTEELCAGTNLSHIVTGDVDGDGREEFVLGDRDGYLYLINAEDGTLVWNMKFEAAVGNPILADSDGDGKIEIIIGVNDGYLYCIDSRKIIATPGFVSDVAVTGDDKIPTDTSDVDEVLQARSYGAIWEAVKEAVSYDVRLKNGDDEVVTERSVVGANQIIIDDFTFYRDDFVYLEVRSVDMGGFKSNWIASDGVTYVDEFTDDSDNTDISDSDSVDAEISDIDLEDIDETTESNGTDIEDDQTDDTDIEIKKGSDGCGCGLI